MFKLSILVPDATVNYIKNPSLRYDTTDWNASGATLTRTLDAARFGVSSLKVVTNGAALNEGAYYRVNALVGISSPITSSIYVRGTGIVRLRMIDNPTGKQWVSSNLTLRSDRWQRLWVSGTITGSNDVRLYVETNEGSAKARTFYLDGAQMELKAYATTFCDGDQDGCRWDGGYHSSISRRGADTRVGGVWYQIAGDARLEQDLYTTEVSGLGMAPLTNNVQSYALETGGYFDNVKTKMRVITVTFHAKHSTLFSRDRSVSLQALHELRQFLIDILKPDRTGGREDMWFEYQDGERPLYFQARYDGGLDGTWDVRNQWVNSFPVRFLSVNPIILEDSYEVAQLDFQDTILPNNIVGRINGQWSIMNYGFNGAVARLATGRKGELYAQGGAYTVINNNAAAVDPLVGTRGPVYWDGQKWNKLTATGMNTGAAGIGGIAVAPNGDIYVCGGFSSIGGVAAAGIAKYSQASGTWSALGTGLGGPAVGYTVVVAPNGDVYVGGNFTSAGGVTCVNIARWDGFQWRRVGQFGGLNGTVQDIAISPDGAFLYVGGDFTTENGGGKALQFITTYDIAQGQFLLMAAGLNGNVRGVKLSKTNNLYICGFFAGDAGGGTALNGVAYWNGSAWKAMGSGIENPSASVYVQDLAIDANEQVYAAGLFTTMDGKNIRYLAIWNGSSWLPSDIKLPNITSNTFTPRLLVNIYGDVILGGSFASTLGSTLVSGLTTVTNPGSLEIYPDFYIVGPATLKFIENQTTKKRMYFDLLIQNGEEITINMAKGQIQSSVRGDLASYVLPGSDFRRFTLAPGDNTIAAFMVDDVGASMQIGFQPKHWSVDATG